MRALLVLLLGVTLAAGCCSKDSSGKTTTCSVTFQNSPTSSPTPTCDQVSGAVSGYLVFSGNTSILKGTDVIVQWSTDSFVSDINSSFIVNNSQGFVVVPFAFSISMCSGGSMTLQLRAWQSADHSLDFKAGDANGRYDGTDSGNTTFQNVTLTSAGASGLLIYLDGTGAQ